MPATTQSVTHLTHIPTAGLRIVGALSLVGGIVLLIVGAGKASCPFKPLVVW